MINRFLASRVVSQPGRETVVNVVKHFTQSEVETRHDLVVAQSGSCKKKKKKTA